METIMMLVKIMRHEEDRTDWIIVCCYDSKAAKDKEKGLGYRAARTSPLPYRLLIWVLTKPR